MFSTLSWMKGWCCGGSPCSSSLILEIVTFSALNSMSLKMSSKWGWAFTDPDRRRKKTNTFMFVEHQRKNESTKSLKSFFSFALTHFLPPVSTLLIKSPPRRETSLRKTSGGGDNALTLSLMKACGLKNSRKKNHFKILNASVVVVVVVVVMMTTTNPIIDG